MNQTYNGKYYVDGWDEDLKTLKHYRWIRNQIAHEPGCTEENMCEKEDAEWLDDFYERILNQTDPLALYRQAIHSINQQEKKQHNDAGSAEPEHQPIAGTLLIVCLILIFIILFLIL